jgi:predicted MPP superfamily phosphohydrolase
MKLTRRKFLKTSLMTAAAGLGGLGWVMAQPEQLDVNPVELTLPRLPVEFDGYKVIQLSDIHMGSGMTEDELREVVAIVNALEPDLIALTGDYVTLGRAEPVADILIRWLGQLSAKDHVIGVLGNHDRHANAEQTQAILAESNVMELSNDVFTLERDGAMLNISGVDSAWYDFDRLDVVLDKLPNEGGSILLMHEPDFADSSGPTGRFDLQISGHSHGGQIVLPSGPIVLPRLGKKYHTGQYQVGNMIQYTNRGVGTTPPPIRINCPPEVTVFTLRSPAV